MLDTVLLCAEDYRLRDGNLFMKQETIKPTGELAGTLQYLNTERVQADTRGGMLRVKTSLPKLVFGTSLREVGERDYRQAIRLLDAELDRIGAEVVGGAAGMTLHRLDYCRNLVMQGDVADSIAAVAGFGMARRTARQYGFETISQTNRSRQLTIYDKVAEILANKKTPDAEREQLQTARHNVLRVECRLMRLKPMEKELHMARPRLRDVWSREESRRVLCGEFDRLTAGDEKAESILSAAEVIDFLAQHRRGAFPLLLQQLGARDFLGLFDHDFSLIRRMMKDAGMSERTVRWRIAHLRRVSAAGIKATPAGVVLREIRSKLAA